jgi:transposase, IS5 family
VSWSHHYLPLIAGIINQSQPPVFHGEAVPAGEKLVSLFEPHATSPSKGGRQVYYGHKLKLEAGDWHQRADPRCRIRSRKPR